MFSIRLKTANNNRHSPSFLFFRQRLTLLCCQLEWTLSKPIVIEVVVFAAELKSFSWAPFVMRGSPCGFRLDERTHCAIFLQYRLDDVRTQFSHPSVPYSSRLFGPLAPIVIVRKLRCQGCCPAWQV